MAFPVENRGGMTGGVSFVRSRIWLAACRDLTAGPAKTARVAASGFTPFVIEDRSVCNGSAPVVEGSSPCSGARTVPTMGDVAR
jgi:hypothetical protein